MNKKFEQRSAKLKELQFLSRICGGGNVGLAKNHTFKLSHPKLKLCLLRVLLPLLTDADFKQETLLYITDVGVYGNICIWNGKKLLPILEQIA